MLALFALLAIFGLIIAARGAMKFTLSRGFDHGMAAITGDDAYKKYGWMERFGGGMMIAGLVMFLVGVVGIAFTI